MQQGNFICGIKELARYLGCSEPTAAKLAHRKDFCAVWISPRKVIFPLSALENWLSKQAGA